jgi:hypothetical protein
VPIDTAGAPMDTTGLGADVSGVAVAVSGMAVDAVTVDPVGAGLPSSDVTCC